MKKYSDLEYLKLPKWKRLIYTIICVICGIPSAVVNFFKNIGLTVVNVIKGIGAEAADIWFTFVNGDWKTRVSYLVMGFGSIARGQVLRGILFLAMEIIFIVTLQCGL